MLEAGRRQQAQPPPSFLERAVGAQARGVQGLASANSLTLLQDPERVGTGLEVTQQIQGLDGVLSLGKFPPPTLL